MPRYVILEHDHPVLHWDLMLEAGDVLQTWRLAQAPTVGVLIDATALADHRSMYLDYEGPVSGNRGTVKRWDAGEFSEDVDATVDLRKLTFHGERVRGNVALLRTIGSTWRFEWRA